MPAITDAAGAVLSHRLMKFYALEPPEQRYSSYAVYGSTDGEDSYPRALLTPGKHIGRGFIKCPVNPGHNRGIPYDGELFVDLAGPLVGDFHWRSAGDCLVTEKTRIVLEEEGLTGFEVRRVHVRDFQGIQRDNTPLLWQLGTTGNAGRADSQSGIDVVIWCPVCELLAYSSYRNGIWVNEQAWNGSDFTKVTEYPGIILVTERVRNVIERHRFTNCLLIESTDLRWPEGLRRPEDVYGAENS